MVVKNWFKDVLLICVGLAMLVSIAAYLLTTDRVKQPESFGGSASVENVSNQVDSAIDVELDSIGLVKAGRADSLKIARRLSLALCGSLPSLEELREITKFDEDQQVDWYVSHLLEDQRSADYLAERFARVFVGVDGGPFLVYRRERFVDWLAEQLAANRPYHRLVQDMLASDGTWTSNPAVNFYTANIIPDVDEDTKPDPIKLASRTSRAFLGMRIDCLQCHDDFIGTVNLGDPDDPGGGTQLDFHQLASFFSQVENSVVGIRDKLDSSTYNYRLLDADKEAPIKPVVPFFDELVDENSSKLRSRLAEWITHKKNRPFARAAVNRVWAMMFGRGLINPVDHITLEGPFPAALEILADDFIENDYDLHRLIRLIAQTDVFQRDSATDFEVTDANRDSWAAFPMTRLRPEQVAGAIAQSTSLTTIDLNSHIVQRLAQFGLKNDFVDRFGDSGEEEFSERNETISQRLLMLNGDVIRERLSNGLSSTRRISGLSPDMTTALETVYLVTLCREPSEQELAYFEKQFEPLNRFREKNRGIEDLYWALMNSTEFRWNH